VKPASENDTTNINGI